MSPSLPGCSRRERTVPEISGHPAQAESALRRPARASAYDSPVTLIPQPGATDAHIPSLYGAAESSCTRPIPDRGGAAVRRRSHTPRYERAALSNVPLLLARVLLPRRLPSYAEGLADLRPAVTLRPREPHKLAELSL